MKRYVTTLALVLLAAAGISTYYAFGSADHLPEYRLETLEGDMNEAANLVLTGSYIGGKGSQSMDLSVYGNEYSSRKSLYDSYITDARGWFYKREGMKELIEKYPAFMRGKSEVGSFYQNQNWVVYARIPYHSTTYQSEGRLEIEMLNRSTGKTTDYSAVLAALSQSGMNGYAEIYDVQLHADGLHVLVNHFAIDDGPSGASQHYDYIMNTESGQLIKANNLAFIDAAGSKLTPLSSSIIQNDYTVPNDYAVLSIVMKEQTVKASSSSDHISAELYVYSYKSGMTQRLPDEMQKLDASRMGSRYISGDELYFINYTETQTMVSRYSLETGEQRGETLSLMSGQFGADEIKSSFIKGGRLYMLLADGDARIVLALDAANGDVLYKGSLTAEGSEEERVIALSDVWLDNMSFKY